jgi:hypothetical protein
MLFRPLCAVCRRIIAARYPERGGNRNEIFDSHKSLFSISTLREEEEIKSKTLETHPRNHPMHLGLFLCANLDVR